MRSLQVRARFGLPMVADASQHADRLRNLHQAARDLHSRLRPGELALITGPSGSGKSLALRSFTSLSGAATVPAISPTAKRAPIAMLSGDLDQTLAVLSAVGLGEARRLITPAGALSDGERARLALARAIWRANGRDLVCDEFTSPLDRLTARSLCRCVRRTLAPDQRLVCATGHSDVATMLNPELVLLLPLLGPPQLLERKGRDADDRDQCVA